MSCAKKKKCTLSFNPSEKMREAAFVRKNKENWVRFEKVKSTSDRIAPDELADLFVRVTDDLAYARTYYPGSSTELYLNRLAGLVARKIVSK